MIKLRTASALAVGAVAALAIGGAALASDGADDGNSVPMLPNGDVITPSPSFTDDSASPSPSVTDDSASPSPSASSTSPSAGASASASASSAGAISIDAAKAIAIRVVGGGYVESVERETEHGRAVWDVDVISGGVEHDIDVDRATGEVLRHKADDRKSGSTSSSGYGSSDDHGRDGSDDKGGHGSDDNGGDDKGGHGHGSDD